LDVELERADREITRFIDKRSKQRQEANAFAMREEADRKRCQAEERERNRLLWIAHYRGLARSQRECADDNERKALQLEEGA
jgi:hypothetical protein